MKKKLSFATITTISTALCIVMFFVCSYLFDHQILFTNQCKSTCNYFDNIEQLIILLALLDPIIYAIFVYLLPEHSKKVHNKTNTTLKRILLIFLSFLWIGTILFTLFSHFKFLLFSRQSFISNIKTPLSRDVFVILIQLLLFCNRHTR